MATQKQGKERIRPKAHKIDQFLVLNYSLRAPESYTEEYAASFLNFNVEVVQALAQKPGLHAYAAPVPKDDFKVLVVYEIKDPKSIEDIIRYTHRVLGEASKKYPEPNENQEISVQLDSVGLVDRKIYEKDISDKVNSLMLK